MATTRTTRPATTAAVASEPSVPDTEVVDPEVEPFGVLAAMAPVSSSHSAP